MSTDDVLAILCSDIHLSHRPPLARSAELDWYVTMANYLMWLSNLQEEHYCPVVIAGDIFDRWNSPPELINFAIDRFPKHAYAIPGQHDLPYHSMDNVHKSAYWTLAHSGTIYPISHGQWVQVGGLCLHGFPWKCDVLPRGCPDSDKVHLAVVHAYCWSAGHSYPGAPEEGNLVHWKKKLGSYDAAVFGDNHKGFIRGTTINCGTFFRRKIDEIEYRPMVGLLRKKGGKIKIDPIYLDTSQDIFVDMRKGEAPDRSWSAQEFIDDLTQLAADDSLNFEEAILSKIQESELNGATRDFLLKALETAKNDTR